MTPIQRFWSKTIVQDNCIIWMGALQNKGYGSLTVNKKSWLAHRWIYFQCIELTDKLLMHTCDNPACVKLQHLSPGNKSLNALDAVKKDMWTTGERNGFSKLTNQQVKEIKLSVGLNQFELANKYSVSQAQISRILRGKSRGSSK